MQQSELPLAKPKPKPKFSPAHPAGWRPRSRSHAPPSWQHLDQPSPLQPQHLSTGSYKGPTLQRDIQAVVDLLELAPARVADALPRLRGGADR